MSSGLGSSPRTSNDAGLSPVRYFFALSFLHDLGKARSGLEGRMRPGEHELFLVAIAIETFLMQHSLDVSSVDVADEPIPQSNIVNGSPIPVVDGSCSDRINPIHETTAPVVGPPVAPHRGAFDQIGFRDDAKSLRLGRDLGRTRCGCVARPQRILALLS